MVVFTAIEPDDHGFMHYGTKRHSGRYPWGSGEKYQRARDFRMAILELKKQGISEKDIAKGMGIIDANGEGNIKFLRDYITISKTQENLAKIAQINKMKEHGMSNDAIGAEMGMNESSVRALLDPLRQEKERTLETTESILKEQVDRKKYIDVGAGIEQQVGVSRKLLDSAVFDLENQGYTTCQVSVEQLGTGKQTWMKVLTKDEVTQAEVYKNRDKIGMVDDVYSDDGGDTYLRNAPVKHLDPKRVMVKFDEDGGTDYDGEIFIRPGVDDLSLNGKKYAQVRIAVDNDEDPSTPKFMKGMAIYRPEEEFPDGVDIIYNSNKSRDVGKFGAMKDMDPDGDPTNPFGSTIRQVNYTDKDGNEQLSPLNRVGYSSKFEAGEEGMWATWNTSRTLASQFLSKQNPDVAKEQLNLAVEIQKGKLDEINKVPNALLKQRLLDAFSDECDSMAVDMQGAALPGQATKILLSEPTIKATEVYAPGYENGTKLALVRYPHAGPTEIPVLTVNNKNPIAKKVLGTAEDAIMLHPKAMSQLSGADSDGDTATVIRWNSRLITSPPLEDMKNFNPKVYKYPKEIINDPTFKDKKAPIHKMTDYEKGLEMGKITNLITDATVKGCTPSELARMIKHSQVVIDAPKHDLNYKQSYLDNDIASLKIKYQGGANKGASTILSRSTSDVYTYQTRPLRKGDPGYENVVRRNEYSVDKATGQKVFAIADSRRSFVKKDGTLVEPGPPRTKSSRMYETEDARTLLSSKPAPIEITYANFANSMKALGNQARKASINTVIPKMNPSAKQTYAPEIKSIDAKLSIAQSNRPLERAAQRIGGQIVKMQQDNNPNLTKEQLKKIKGQAIETARLRVGAGKERVQLTEREWEAINSNAISSNKLSSIFANTALADLQKAGTPRTARVAVSTAQEARIRNMISRGYTQQEIAEVTGLSVSTVSNVGK